MVVLTIRVSELDGKLIKCYAAYKNETVSSLVKKVLFEQIEEDYRKLVEIVETDYSE